ncbi:unnamed protein product [Clonostachys solani]|uniref:CRAL-TRIO domain-containing protein n=1 Tax=Clonostachys solani TaxID=160281 RepID=A0A9P0EN95_9HYPO|nr:unnamed protein product [Clonostachys solani]
MTHGTATAPPHVSRVASHTSHASHASHAGAEFAYPHGHLGALSEREEEALAKFKTLLEEKGYWKPGPPPSHDDATLLRFLRARRWVPEDAFGQFKDTEDWRQGNDVDVLYSTIDLEAYEQCRRLYPQWTGRRDRRGIPLYVFQVKNLDHKTVSEYEKHGANNTFSEAKTDGKTPPNLLRLFALYENLTRFAMPLCTELKDREHAEAPITMSTNIVDISGVGLKQFWNLKNHMQAASQLATAHYPETLDRIFIIGAPYFFSTVWGWIKRWFDPITVSKIFVLSHSEVKPTLESFIEPRNIPKKYGGELDYTFGELGVADPHWDGVITWEDGFNSFPGGPLLWEDSEDGKSMTCYGLGVKDGKKRKEKICTLPKTYEAPAPKPATNGVSKEIEEKTEEAKPAETVINGEALEKLKISDEKKAEAASEVPQAQSVAAA